MAEEAEGVAPGNTYYDFSTSTTWHVLHDDASGFQYYWNAESGESTYERSVGFGLEVQAFISSPPARFLAPLFGCRMQLPSMRKLSCEVRVVLGVEDGRAPVSMCVALPSTF
jgi:hypothetical protein